MVSILSILVSCAGPSSQPPGLSTPTPGSSGTSDTAQAFEALAQQAGFVVAEGTVGFLDPGDCCEACANCLWNNPSTPYGSFSVPPAPDQLVPDPPDNAAGATFFLRPDEGIVFLGRTPPPARYFSLRSYLAERLLTASDPLPPPTDPGACGTQPAIGVRAPVLGSLGPSLNQDRIAEQLGGDPFDQSFALITTADAAIEAQLSELLVSAGWDPRSVFVDRIPAADPELGLRLGLQPEADSFQMAIRIAVYEDEEQGAAYQAAPGRVLRLSPGEPGPARQPHPAQPLPPIGTGTTEAHLADAVDRLEAAIRAAYPGSVGVFNETRQWDYPTYDCFDALYCSGEIRDRYYARVPSFWLPVSDTFAVAFGVNHERSGKASYANASVDTVLNLIGLRGFDSSTMVGSARAFLPDDPQADELYAWVIARDCAPHAGRACYALPETCPEGLALHEPLFVSVRAYLEPGTGAKPLGAELVPDRVGVFVPGAP